MKLLRSLGLAWIGLLLVSVVGLRGAEAGGTAAGHWEGSVTLPNAELSIRVDLTREGDNAWQGTIDMPQQGLRAFKLDPVKVDGATITFALPGIPGDPRFSGKLAAEANAIAGDFSQGEHTFPFKLERKAKPAPTELEGGPTPARGVAGKGLAGTWRGSLRPIPAVELRLVLELTAAGGKTEGVLVSLDQAKARIPLTTLTETNGAVHFETASIGGAFEGKLNADGSELAGDWTQGGRTMPVVFMRAEPAGK